MSCGIRTIALAFAVGILCLAPVARADDDDANEQRIAERFAAILQKNPRPGTSFDKVYAYHVERGTLEDWLTKHRRRAEAGRGIDSAADWMIVGLIEAQRGRDVEVIQAFTAAESLDVSNFMAAYLLGKSLIATGQAAAAAEAFERAIQRQPAGADLLEVFQALGRIYQRTQKMDKALDVWNRLEREFPNDARVQEQIATTLLEENDLVAALPRFEKLALVTKDKYRQSLFLVEVADIKVRLGKADEGLQDLEKLLRQLNPENWLFHEIRRRIEAVFLKQDNEAGLIAYYEKWIQGRPEDIDAALRLARLLASAGRRNDAQALLRQCLKRAPSNKDLRQTLIAQLSSNHQYREAADQYLALNNIDPNNPDTLRDWGRTLMQDTSRPEDERRQAAAAVWQKLVAARPNDAHTASHVADLFRSAGMSDEAIEQYRLASELAPDSEQYREYLGEYLHSLKRTDEALVVWRQMATESRRSAATLARLAEILARHDQVPEAIVASSDACQLDAKDFSLQLKHADLLVRAGKLDLALQQLSVVQKISASDEEREAGLRRELQTLKSLNRLEARIVAVCQQIEQRTDNEKALDWYWIARAEEAADRTRAAIVAIGKAMTFIPNSIPTLIAAARLYEREQDLRGAVEVYTRLAATDRRSRTEHLKRIALLEEKRGHSQQALHAGRELLAASPNNPQTVEAFADLCFRLGKHEEGMQALRRSLRTNPADLSLLIRLATMQLESNQSKEAIDLLWQGFERSHRHDDRMALVQKLTNAYSKTGQLKTLFDRLIRESRVPAQHREMTTYLALAYEISEDPATAQTTLESLLTDENRDSVLLAKLRDLAVRQNDLPAAIRFQRQIWKLTSHPQDQYQLAQLLLRSGDSNEAMDLIANDAGTAQLTAETLRLLDSLDSQGHHAETLARVRSLRKRFPDNWELLYREAMLNVDSSPVAAKTCFEKLLKMDCSEDEPSLLGPSTRAPNVVTETRLPLIERLEEAARSDQARILMPVKYVTRTTGNAKVRVAASRSRGTWSPGDFGTARLAALYCLVQSPSGGLDRFLIRDSSVADVVESRQQLVDRIVIQRLQGNLEAAYQAVRELMQRSADDIEARVLYLKLLEERGDATLAVRPKPKTVVSLQPLSMGRLQEAQAVYQEVAARRDLIPLNVTLLRGLMRELTLAGQQATAKELLANVATNVATPVEVASLLELDGELFDFTVTMTLFERLLEMPHLSLNSRTVTVQNSWAMTTIKLRLPEQLTLRVIPVLKKANRDDDLLALWDRYLQLCARESAQQFRAGSHGFSSKSNGTGQDAIAGVPGIMLSTEVLNVLFPIRRHFQNQQRMDELIEEFRARSQSEGLTADERLFRQHALACLLQLNKDSEGALEILLIAAKEYPARQDLRWRLMRQFEIGKQPARALAMLDTLEPATAEDRRELEKEALRLAIKTSQFDRARTAAERICDSTIESHEIVAVASELMRSGQKEAVEEILDRVRRSRPLELAELRVLMDVQLARDKLPEATATATDMLEQLSRLPSIEVSAKSTRSQVRLQVRSFTHLDSNRLRRHCLNVLHQTGRLSELIEFTEKKLESSSELATINLLIEYCGVSGNRPRIKELVLLRTSLRPGAAVNRYDLALSLLENNQTAEALNAMQLLAGRDPDYIASRCRPTLLRYEGRTEQDAFIRLLEQIDWGREERMLSALSLVIQDIQSLPGGGERAEKLFVKVWEAHPRRRLDLLQRFADLRWWNLDVVRDGMHSLLKPAETAPSRIRWNMLGRSIQSPEASASLVTVWNRMLSLAAATSRLDALAVEIEDGIQKSPDWIEGELMQAMLEMRRGRIEIGRNALDRLLPVINAKLRTRPVMAWEIGQELAQHKEGLDVAAKYFAVAIERSHEIDWMKAASPAGQLIDAYVRHGRTSDARTFLLRRVPSNLRFHPTSVLNPASDDVSQVVSITGRLQSLNDPIEAIEICFAAQKRLGDDLNPEIQTTLGSLFAESDPAALAEYLERFDAHSQQLHFYVSLPDLKADPRQLRGGWDSILNRIASDPILVERTQKGLERLFATQADKIVPLVFSSQLWFAVGNREQAAQAAARLLRYLDEQTLNARTNQNDEGLPKAFVSSSVCAWLIARECLNQPQLGDVGARLAQRALDSSLAEKTLPYSTLILSEWIQIALKTGDIQSAERLKSELERLQRP